MPSTSSLGRVLLVLLALSAFAGIARADEPVLQNGIAVVTDPASLARTTTAGPVEVVELSVVLTDLDFDGVSAVQFGLDVDPRLTVLQTNFSDDAGVVVDVGDSEWIVGFDRCVARFVAPYTVLTLTVLTPADAGDLDDLVVDVRDLTTYGEGIAVTRCSDARYVYDAVDMGGAVINPSGAGISFFGVDRPIVVEGRDYTLGWSTHGASAVQLDGASAASAGVATRTAVGTTTHTLNADGAWSTVDVEVIREPRINSFFAEFETSSNPPRVRLSWDVVGSDLVQLEGYGIQPPRGGLVVSLGAQEVFTLSASNEFGTVSADVIAEGADDVPPVVLTFTANPTVFGVGDAVTLFWSIYAGDTATITPDVGAIDPRTGTAQVFPTAETTYTLTVSNVNGTTTETVTVHPSPPRIDAFTVSPNLILRGESVTVGWSVRYADTVRLEPDGLDLAASGSLTLEPQVPTSYRLVATNAFGETEAQQNVEVLVPEITRFDIAPTSTFPGAPVVAQWNATPGMALRIEPDVGPLDSAQGTLPFVTSAPDLTYRLIGTVAGEDVVEAQAGPIAWLPPTIGFEVLTDPIVPNEPFVLRVSLGGADRATISGEDPYDPAPEVVQLTTTVGQPTTFVVTAENAAGTTVDSVLIEPEPLAPLVTLSAQPTASGGVLFPGDDVRLNWSVRYAAEATLLPGVGAIANGSGTAVVPVDEATTFEVAAHNAYGTATATADATPQPPVVALSGSETAIVGQSFELLLEVRGQDEVTIEPIFGVVPGTGRYTATLDSSTTFTATATNAVGQTTASWRVETTAPEILNFFAVQPSVIAGQSARLRWHVLGAASLSIFAEGALVAGDLDPIGEIEVTPTATTEYEIVATNPVGTVTATATVSVLPIAIQSFTALPSTVPAGGLSELSWSAIGEGELELVGFGPVDLVGSRVVQVDMVTTFELVARSGGVEVDRRSVTVSLLEQSLNLVRWAWDEDGGVLNPPPVIPFVPFEAWIVTEDPSGGILAFELRAEVPAELFVLSAMPPQSTGLAIFGHPDWVVGTGVCLYGDVIPLLRYEFMSVGTIPYDAALDISGLPDNSSLPSGEPAFSNCANNIVPFEIGSPLYVNGIVVPTLSVELEATAQAGGVELQWSARGVTCADRVHVFRTVGSDAVERVAELRALDACGSWTDTAAPARLDDVRYRVSLETASGALVSTDVAVENAPSPGVLPSRSTLLANVPNPFNPATELRFALAQEGPVQLAIYDAAGRLVRRIDLGRQPMGEGHVTWTGVDDAGRPVGSGVYLVRLNTSDGVDTRRILLVK